MEFTVEQLNQQLEKFIAYVQRRLDEYNKQWTTPLNDSVEIERAKKYIRIYKVGLGGKMIHSLVDTTNGNLLRPATATTPVKNGIRGSLFEEEKWATQFTAYGPTYLR